MIDVHHVIARLQIREIAEETRSLRPRARTLLRSGGQGLEEVCVAIQSESRVNEHHAVFEGSFDQHHGRTRGSGTFFGKARHRGVFFEFAHAIGQLELVADVGKAFEFTRARGRDKNVFACGDAAANFGYKRGHVTVIPSGGLGVKRAV